MPKNNTGRYVEWHDNKMFVIHYTITQLWLDSRLQGEGKCKEAMKQDKDR